MTPEQNAAYVVAQTVFAMIEAMGMQAENQYRDHHGNSPAYCDADFNKLIEKYGIHHNAVFTVFQP